MFLGSVTCKILEHIITLNIQKCLYSKGILVDAQQQQHGFRTDVLAINIKTGSVTNILILYFDKSFHSVNRSKLLFMLEKVWIDLI